MNNFKYKFIAFFVLILMESSLYAQNWPQWRGPNANGVSELGNYPVHFSSTEDIFWKAELPGKGGSTPIVWKDHIVLTSGTEDSEDAEDGVLCYDWGGNLLWQVRLGKEIPGKHPRGSGSSPSAVTDGERLFVYFKSTTVAALDFNGNVLWKTNLQENYGEIMFFWDLGTSPVLVEGNVVIAVMHEGKSYLIALEQATGKVTWKVDRNYICSRETAQSYSTPLLVTEGDQTTIVVWGADHLTGHSAKTGEIIWSYGGFNPDERSAWRTIASPVFSQGIAVVPYGRGRYLAGMKTSGKIDMSEKDYLWEKDGIGSDIATPVVNNCKVYILNFGGKLWCLDILTGKELWQTELQDARGVFYSSPTLAENMLYICSDVGEFYVCEVSPNGIQVINYTVFDDNFVASPVLVQDKILLRGTKYLYCIGN